MADISINLEGCTVNLRVAAVIARGGEVLVCRLETENWWYLPGGRIKTNESSIDAISRELREEIGDWFHISRPIICAENFFNLHGVSFHEFCTFYEAAWFGGDRISPKGDTSEVFEWIARSDLTAVDLRPAFMKQYIVNPPPTLQLVIHRDGQTSEAMDRDCDGGF